MRVLFQAHQLGSSRWSLLRLTVSWDPPKYIKNVIGYLIAADACAAPNSRRGKMHKPIFFVIYTPPNFEAPRWLKSISVNSSVQPFLFVRASQCDGIQIRWRESQVRLRLTKEIHLLVVAQLRAPITPAHVGIPNISNSVAEDGGL
jgi:hypothetical protein